MGAVASLGNYPKEFNPRVHGPFVPWRHYGPIDTPFSQVRDKNVFYTFPSVNKTYVKFLTSDHKEIMAIRAASN